MELRSFFCGFLAGILTKDYLVKCLMLVCSYLLISWINFYSPYADMFFRVVVALLPEIVGINLVLGYLLVFYTSLLILDWLPTISSPKGLKLLRIILIAATLYLMVGLLYKLIHDAYLILITLQSCILRFAIQSWIGLIILFTILTICCVIVSVEENLRIPMIPHPIIHFRLPIPISHPIVCLFVVIFLVITHAVLTELRGHYWALVYFPHLLGLIYLSFIFPNGIFAATTLFWYVMICYSIVPHEILIKLRLKHEALLLSEEIFFACLQFVLKAFMIGFVWLCLIWFGLQGYLARVLANLETLLFHVDG